MNIKDKPYNQKTVNIIEALLRYSTFIFIFYILTDLRKGGDLRVLIPYISLALIILHLIVRQDYTCLKSHLFYALLGYVLISYLLVPLSFDPEVSLKALNREILTGIPLFLAVHLQTSSNRKIEAVTVFLILLAVFIAGAGYFTFLYKYFSEGVLDHMFPDVRSIKFYLYHNRFAMVLNLLLSFVISYAVSRDKKKTIWLPGLIIVLSAVAVILSLSRGGWVSLAVSSVLWITYFRKNIRQFSVRLTVATLIISTCLLLLVPSFQQRIVKTTEQISTFNERTEIWSNKLSAIRKSPLIGWGYGDNIVWDSAPFLLNETNKEALPREVKIGSHNTMLHVLFHQGLIGCAFFMYLFITGIIMTLKELKLLNGSHPASYAVFCVFISVFIVHSFVETVPFQYICMVLGFCSGIKETLKVEDFEYFKDHA
ncbi:MAG: O-antigen ligase family protein [Nitrospirae bacterium]|nr:O-antigen ligase family protein [Nitrospirota bacterium]